MPLQRLHGDAAAAALARAGVALHAQARVAACSPAGAGVAVRGAAARVEADAVIARRPARGRGRAAAAGARRRRASTGGSARRPIVNLHVHYDRRVLDEPFAAGVGSPVQWVFDRTELVRASTDGQCLAVSLSDADDVDRRAPSRSSASATCPRSSALLPGGRAARGARLRRHARAARDVPGRARHRGACGPGRRTGVPGLYLAGAWTDTGWPATMEGAVRSGLARARAAALGARPREPELAAA